MRLVERSLALSQPQLDLWGSAPLNALSRFLCAHGNGISPEKQKDEDALSACQIDALIDNGMLRKVPTLKSSQRPVFVRLKMTGDYKLYLYDTGLYGALLDVDYADFKNSFVSNSMLRGVLAEQFVQQELRALGLTPYNFHTQKDDGIPEIEIDFTLELKGSKYPLLPVEVKSGKELQSKSLQRFSSTYHPQLSVRTSYHQFNRNKAIVDVPLYAVFGLFRTANPGEKIAIQTLRKRTNLTSTNKKKKSK